VAPLVIFSHASRALSAKWESFFLDSQNCLSLDREITRLAEPCYRSSAPPKRSLIANCELSRGQSQIAIAPLTNRLKPSRTCGIKSRDSDHRRPVPGLMILSGRPRSRSQGRRPPLAMNPGPFGAAEMIPAH
jgi:hypothetical protein